MRTSGTQFEMMVTFMEQHGDLNKPTGHARGRIEAINRWEELTTLLNSDASGEKKETEKWKKVWSDMKNNTKKKAARINVAANATGGGPAPSLKLTDLENRVLRIIGHLAATGLDVSEGGFLQVLLTPDAPPTPIAEIQMNIDEWHQSFDHDNNIAPLSSPTPYHTEPVPSTSRQAIQNSHSQTPENSPHRRYRHSNTRNSPRRRLLASPRRRTRATTLTDRVAHEFQQSDSEWRKFVMEKEKREAENQAEQLQIRRIELRLQEQWQERVRRALDILENKLL